MQNNIFKRILTVVLAFALLATPVASGLLNLTASAATQSLFDRVSDHESIDYWKGYFSDGQHDSSVWSNTISTQNAGAVWTDKSVFVPGSTITIDGVDVPVADTGDNFLISMSVMASNKTVKGYEYIPTSTMLVLDVSASMGNGTNGNRSWDEMVEAANKAMDTLLNLNQNNQIGVVLYSGNPNTGNSNIGHSTLLLPLGRYTTTAKNNNGTWNDPTDDYPEYLTASNSEVGINSAVSPSRSGKKAVSGGTYIQGGIYRAMESLISEDAPKVVEEGVQAGMAYTPIVVLMSDGAPTAANLDYDFNSDDENHRTDIGNGTGTSDQMGFLTQLTAAYAKARIAEAYEKAPLFYTLGLGFSSLNDTQESVAEAVLSPSESSGNLQEYWAEYLALDNDNSTRPGNTMYLGSNNSQAVTKNDYVTAEYKNYVNQYFKAEASQNITLEQALLNAFQQIVDMIVLQSVYYPTEIGTGNADLGGYVTFRDELGEYMDVRDIKGFLFEDENGNQVLHTGAKLAENFVSGGGDLGQSSNPKPLGDELVRAVKARLGIEDTRVAQDLIRNAYAYKQLSYTNETEFSNYIGWYGDADGKFVDFWHEGSTAAEQAQAIANGAKFIYKSYGYLGEVNADLGIKASDMMYTTIRVRETIVSGVEGTSVGEVVVEGSIPASLIPTITYEVTLKGKTYESGIDSLTITDTSADFPARILYEVGLRSEINPINIAEKVNASHKNEDGTYTFYTNDWAFVDIENGAVADTSINAFTHFEPASENERYYYLVDSVVYRDAQGTPYTGTNKPSGDGYYHANRVFTLENGRASSEITYIRTSADALTHAERSGSGWVIPGGTGKHEIVGYEVPLKENNNTETNRFTAYPKIKTDAENGTGEHSHHYSVVTFGNNGRLTVTPATGIQITKTLDVPVSETKTFTFTVAGANANEAYTVTPRDAAGNFGAKRIVYADGSGVITVEVDAGTSVFVTGLTPGVYTVTEADHTEYRVLKINGEDSATNTTQVTVAALQTAEVAFENTLKGYGKLFINKTVGSAVAGQTLPAHALNAEFDITVDVGQTLAGNTYDIVHSGNATLKQVTVNANGEITGLKIKHGQTIEIQGLPENTTATVTETLTASQADNYATTYTSHNRAGQAMDNDGVVTIEKDASATVIVNNAYAPVETNITVDFSGTKTMDATDLTEDKTFTFLLEKYEGGWKSVSGWNATATVAAGSNGSQAINFNNFRLELSFTEPGSHTYRITEKGPDAPDGITYDPAVYTFVINVADNNGQLVATAVGNAISGSGTSFEAEVAFTNAYNTEPVVIEVNKVAVDDTKDFVSPAGYEFQLYKANAAGEYTAADLLDTAVTGANGYTSFSWLVDSNDAGTHYYVLKEKLPAGYVKPAADAYGWHYDTREILITVVVSANNGEVSVTVDGDASTNAAYTFTNTYKAQKATVSLESIATKTLNGRNLKAGEFTFQLLDNQNTLLAEGKNAAANNGVAAPITFYKPGTTEKYVLSYEKVGTYHYKLQEVNGGLGGVTYSTRIFDMVVEVTDNGQGALQASYYFEDSASEKANFINTYSITTPTSLVLQATKKLTGDRPMISAEFHFEVYEMTDSTFATKLSTTPVATGYNIGANPDADGVAAAIFPFTAITYTQPGVHYYQVCEVVQSGDWGVEFDETVYEVTVTVTDNGDGTITAAVDKTPAEMVFTNVYEPDSISFGFIADKILSGRPMKDGEFKFALFNATVEEEGGKQVWTAGSQIGETATNAENGDITLPQVQFTEKGVYHYMVKEVAGELGGIVYDDTVYQITVTVTDNHKGALSAEAIIRNDDGELSQIVFTNAYEAEDAGVQLEGTKTLTGAKLKDQQFTFQLFQADEKFAAQGKALQSVHNAADGAIKFANLKFDAEGTYNYVIVEKNDAQKNFTYDNTVWCVTVEVTDDGEGKLIAETTVQAKGNTEAAETFTFANTYKKPEAPKTGDDSNLALWIALAAISCAGIAGLVFTGKKRKNA